MKSLEELKDNYFQENYFIGSKLDESDWIEIAERYKNQEIHSELSQLWRWYDEAGMHGAANVVLGKLRKLESTIATK